MDITLNMNAVNQVSKGSTVYQENKKVESISIIIKGRVSVHKNGIVSTLYPGGFLGICDVYKGTYSINYTAMDDLMVFTFPIDEKEDLEGILSSKKEYRGLMVASLSKYIDQVDKIYQDIYREARSLHDFLKSYYELYKEIGKQGTYNVIEIPLLEELEPFPLSWNEKYKRVNYYKECAKVPLEVQKEFYATSNYICLYHLEEQAELVQQFIYQCTELSCYIFELSQGLMSEGEDCLFMALAKLAMDVEEKGGDNKSVLELIDSVIDKLNVTERLFLEKAGCELWIDREQMEHTYYLLLSGESGTGNSQGRKEVIAIQSLEEIERKFKDSLSQILSYSGLERGKCERFKELVGEWMEVSDRFAQDDNRRKVRKEIALLFYEIYEAVFLKNYQDQKEDLILELFLNYGFMEEKLFTKEQLRQLYHVDRSKKQTGPCQVYSIKEWLINIYEGKKEPSKNEFDLDYRDYLREMRKGNRITEQEAKMLEENQIEKLKYEIYNMFSYNHKLLSGQVSTFVPLLYGEVFMGSLEKSVITAELLNKTIDRVRAIDFTLFYREIMYSNEEAGITREYIMKEVFPDIILLPIYGVKGVMWQEIDGKRRNTSGRFLMPIFCETNIEDIMINLAGRFRWELCRTIQGTSWNNIKYKSLTSEYADYIQFYRKNRDLSEERKEKLKLVIQKCRNNMREVFVSDYELWVKNESQGALRLNKVVREIMATYVPFSKEIRIRLLTQPLFEEAMARYIREKAKKIREIDLRYRALEKEQVELTEELIETREFYLEK